MDSLWERACAQSDDGSRREFMRATNGYSRASVLPQFAFVEHAHRHDPS
jgi:hypothetical protein